MPKEIERKWLMRKSPPPQLLVKAQHLSQIYLPDNLRLRLYSSSAIEAEAIVTLKTGHGLVREEKETQIPLWLAYTMIKSKTTEPLFKWRYQVSWAWGIEGTTIDVFKENLDGLILAEREFNSVEEAKGYILPYMISEYVIREVTDDARYDNFSLASTQKVPTQI